MKIALAMGVLALTPLTGPAAKPARPAEAAKAADPWAIPETARGRRNPVPSNPETVTAGRALWKENCATCHGTSGRGDGPNAKLHERRKGYAPRDVTDPAVQENLTDGEIFWRISHGIIKDEDVIMPSYEAKIPSETERWQLVVFVRELGRAAKKK
jgi:mono/diheme cytochrome c family protein